MSDLLLAAYPWIKALHVTFVIFWMAALFMIPRYFAYHMEADAGSPESDRWKEREARLFRIIANPSMILAWLFGLLMIAARPEFLTGQGWLHAKLLLVVALSGLHGYLAARRKAFARDERPLTGRAWRLINEVPAIVILAVVVLVIVKPF